MKSGTKWVPGIGTERAFSVQNGDFDTGFFLKKCPFVNIVFEKISDLWPVFANFWDTKDGVTNKT